MDELLSLTQIIGVSKKAVVHVLAPEFEISETRQIGGDHFCCNLCDPVSHKIMPIVWSRRDDAQCDTEDKRIRFATHLFEQAVSELRIQIKQEPTDGNIRS